MQKIQQIVIGNDNEFNILAVPLTQALNKRKQLKSITLKSIQCSQNLNLVFQNCRMLQSIVFEWCKDIDDQNLEFISNYCKNLSQLVIKPGLDINNGKAIWTLNNLKTLTLFKCTNLKPETVAKGLQNLSNLVYFSSQQNPWLNNKVLATIGTLHKLQFLRINDCAKVSSAGLLKLVDLKFMETFICQNNSKFYDKDFVTLCQNWPKLQKLGLSWDYYHNTLPSYISKVSKITHLSIKNSQQFLIQDVQLFTELKCLNIGNSGECTLEALNKKFKNKLNIFQTKNNE